MELLAIGLDPGIGRIDLAGLFQPRAGVVIFSLAEIDDGHGVGRIGRLRRKAQDFLEGPQGFVVPVQVHGGQAAVIPGLQIFGPAGDGLVVTGEGSFRLPSFLLRQSQVVPGRR